MNARSISFLFCILLFFKLAGQTTIPGGTVSGIWTSSGSPYYVTNSIMVPDQQTLTIQPGVSVIFIGHYKLVVKGQLRAEGTNAANIIFTATNTTQGWWGIRIDSPLAGNDSTVLSYCIIEQGNANTINDESRGGGIFIKDFTKVRLDHCVLRNNRAVDKGGALYSQNAGFLMSACDLNSNTSPAGGAIACVNATATPGSSIQIQLSSITSNTASFGAGLHLHGAAKIMIASNTISGNASSGQGGGLYCELEEAEIKGNLISANSAGFGAGIKCYYLYFGAISGNTVTDQMGGGTSGIEIEYSKSLLIERNLISNNRSGGFTGLSLFNASGSPTVQNNIIVNNVASSSTSYGGGLIVYNCDGLFQNNTIANNHCAGWGGGVAFANKSNPIFRNNIVYGNTADITGAQIYLLDEGSDPDFFNNNIQGGLNAMEFNGNFFTGTYTNNIDLNPQFNLPTAGSGTTFIGYTANWWLQAGSPCIDAGDLTGIYPANDFAMNQRVTGPAVDIGAYEWNIFVGTSDFDKQTVSVTPNPFNNSTKISVGNELLNGELSLYNQLGKEVMKKDGINGSYVIFSRDQLVCGVYLLMLKNLDKIYTVKVVVAD